MDNDDLKERIHALETAQATQAATAAGAQTTQAAAQAGLMATVVTGSVSLITGIILGFLFSSKK
ncbi:MAG TPA: hypothetical protein VF711_13230 [Acidimicrobiales bacterium]|jgi:F0F1-type ATP synthase assembly protein I